MCVYVCMCIYIYIYNQNVSELRREADDAERAGRRRGPEPDDGGHTMQAILLRAMLILTSNMIKNNVNDY